MEKLRELAGVLGIDCEELYDEVYSEALQEIATRDLAISKILQDLILIRRESSLHADVITEATARPFRADEQNDIVSTYSSTRYYPAPTLAEIMAKLPEGVQMRMRTARNRERHFQIYHYSYETWTNLPAAGALRMWLRIRREAGR